MKKGSSKSTSSPEKLVRRKRKYDEEFKQQALAMVRNRQTARSVAQALGISENLIHRWKAASRAALPATGEIVLPDQLAWKVDEVFWQNSRRGLRQINAESRDQTVVGSIWCGG